MRYGVESVELVLENCESIVIDEKYIGTFRCDEITSTIFRVGCGEIKENRHCKEFFIEIYRGANKRYDSFGDLSLPTAFGRLASFSDIVAVTIKYKDGYRDNIVLPWQDADENGENNALQTSFINKRGDMYVCVCERAPVLDRIGLESVNS